MTNHTSFQEYIERDYDLIRKRLLRVAARLACRPQDSAECQDAVQDAIVYFLKKDRASMIGSEKALYFKILNRVRENFRSERRRAYVAKRQQGVDVEDMLEVRDRPDRLQQAVEMIKARVPSLMPFVTELIRSEFNQSKAKRGLDWTEHQLRDAKRQLKLLFARTINMNNWASEWKDCATELSKLYERVRGLGASSFFVPRESKWNDTFADVANRLKRRSQFEFYLRAKPEQRIALEEVVHQIASVGYAKEGCSTDDQRLVVRAITHGVEELRRNYILRRRPVVRWQQELRRTGAVAWLQRFRFHIHFVPCEAWGFHRTCRGIPINGHELLSVYRAPLEAAFAAFEFRDRHTDVIVDRAAVFESVLCEAIENLRSSATMQRRVVAPVYLTDEITSVVSRDLLVIPA